MSAKSDKIWDKRKKERFPKPKPTIPQGKRILIICEDSKTALKYFIDMREGLGLSKELIEIRGKECGSAPTSVYDFAAAKLELSIKDDNEYDLVFCVIDRDTHNDFDPVLNKIKQQPKKFKEKIQAIVSIPCFEVWVLLHFVYSSAPFENCNAVCKKIKKPFPEYEKEEMRILYPFLKDKTGEAIKNARKLVASMEVTDSKNPITYIHEVVEILQKEAKQNK